MATDDAGPASGRLIHWILGFDLTEEIVRAHADRGSWWRVRTPGGSLWMLRWDPDRGFVQHSWKMDARPLLTEEGRRLVGDKLGGLATSWLRGYQFLQVDEDGEAVFSGTVIYEGAA